MYYNWPRPGMCLFWQIFWTTIECHVFSQIPYQPWEVVIIERLVYILQPVFFFTKMLKYYKSYKISRSLRCIVFVDKA